MRLLRGRLRHRGQQAAHGIHTPTHKQCKSNTHAGVKGDGDLVRPRAVKLVLKVLIVVVRVRGAFKRLLHAPLHTQQGQQRGSYGHWHTQWKHRTHSAGGEANSGGLRIGQPHDWSQRLRPDIQRQLVQRALLRHYQDCL